MTYQAMETIKVYHGNDVGASQCLVTLEGFIGDMDNAELADDSTVDTSDAVTAINGLIWSLEQRDAKIKQLLAALKPFASIAEMLDAQLGDLRDDFEPLRRALLVYEIPKVADLRRARAAFNGTEQLPGDRT